MKNLILALLLVASAYGVQHYALPAWERIGKYRAEIKQIENVQAKAEEIRDLREKAIERFKSISQEDIDRLNTLLPEKIKSEEMYVFFKNLTQSAGMRFGNVIILGGAEAEGQGKKSLSFDLQSAGAYEPMRTLIDKIENNLRIMDIETLGITQNDASEYLLSIKGKMYYGY